MAELSSIVLWKHAKTTTFAIYVIALVTAPINQTISALALFTLCCFWSRIVTLLNDYAKDLDVIDFFSVLIAINMSGWIAAIFAWFNLIFPRLFGPVEPLNYTIKDSISMAFAALFTPIWYGVFNHNLLLTMYMFTVHRYAHYLLLNLLFDQQAMGGSFIYMFIGVPISYFMNTILVKVLGPAMEDMFAKGIVVSKEVFIFTTIVIGIIYAVSYYRRKRKKEKVVVKQEEEEQHINVPEPWEVPLMILSSSNTGLTMTDTEFSVSATIVFFVFFVVRCFVMESLPSRLQFLVILLFYASAIVVVGQYIKWVSKKAVSGSLPGILKSVSLGVVVLIGFGIIM